MVTQIYPIELYKAHLSDIEAQFFDLHLSVSNGFDSSKIYDKRDEFNLTVYFPFLMVCTFLNVFSLLQCLVSLLFQCS